MRVLSRWLLCIAIILSLQCLASAQLVVASIALLTDAVGDVTSVLTILGPVPTSTTTTTQVLAGAVQTVTAAVAAAAAPVEPAASVLVTNIVQTTLVGTTPVEITSQVSVPLLPAITSGAATLAIGSNTYTVSINAAGNTVVNGKTNVVNGATGASGQVLQTVINGQTILETVIGGVTMQEVVIDGKTVGETVVGGKTMAVWATVIDGNTVIESSAIDGSPSTIFGTTKTVGSTSTATAGSRSSKPPGLGVAAGIAIGIGCTFLLVVLGTLLLCLVRRARKRRQQREQEDQEMSAIVGVGADDDRASSVARSDTASEKFEIDGRERRAPVELPGDYWPQEMDARAVRSQTPSSLYARDVKVLPDYDREVEDRDMEDREMEDREVQDRAQLHSQDTATDTLSGIVSPIARSNSEREVQWPLGPSPHDVSPTDGT